MSESRRSAGCNALSETTRRRVSSAAEPLAWGGPSLRRDGAQMCIAYVVSALDSEGVHRIEAVAQLARDHDVRLEVYALAPGDCDASKVKATAVEVHVRDGDEVDHLAAWAWIDRQVGRTRPDLIWTSQTRATLLGQQIGRWRRIPVASWLPATTAGPASRVLFRACCDLSALWIADSVSAADAVGPLLSAPAQQLLTWPLFAPSAGTQQAPVWRDGATVHIGTLGRHHPDDGFDVLLDALAFVNGSSLGGHATFDVRIAGEGPGRTCLQTRARVHDLKMVRLVGVPEDPAAFLGGLQLYVQPSRTAGLCASAHEAMQAGVPCVVSGIGEPARTVRDGSSGLVVPPGDPVALAQALVWLLDHPDRLAAMGVAARTRVLERFSLAAFARDGGAVMARLSAICAHHRPAVLRFANA